ncbi:hypothetical protein CFC21_096322 [Triticum aestivum]|uniref:DUF569 domain-containing protein n=3 Tax=Triticum TaxID=4564 RepID=A0A9R0Z4M9_TRITD|nr:uncharacterized protein LOC123152014 [Triticum aestivum]KAF7093956.1 hypothetical protein CFC21_096322 [Triticum aestivum]VAI70894.1 unnamed protein product [Triticum turgidum subsp. durum]
MELFQHGQHVRLRSRALGTYLHADDDGQGASLHHRRASMNAAWAVHVHHPPRAQVPYLLLHSAAYGLYLAATDGPAPVGLRGFRVELRSYDHREADAVCWTASRTGSGDDVRLQHFNLGCLRANGKYLPWNNGASIGHIDGASTMMHWVVEPIPARETMPPLPRSTGLTLPRAVLPSRQIVYVWTDNHGDLITSGWHTFRGRSVFHLRKELARLLNAVQVLGVGDLVLCLPTRDGRLFPLLVDLPNNRQPLHVVVVIAGTPLHARLRYADVDAE